MNPQLKERLDDVCKKQAIKHSVSEKFVNMAICCSILAAKLGVIRTFCTSKTIDVDESVTSMSQEISSILLAGAAACGFVEESVEKAQMIYVEVNNLVVPLLQVTYTTPINSSEKPS